jgi:membrane protein
MEQVRWWSVTLAREWRADRVTGLAAEIAFYGILSLFPAMLALAAGMGWMQAIIGADAARSAERELLDFLRRILTSEASGTIDAVERLFTSRRTGVLSFGAAAALWSLARAFSGVVDALDVVYEIEERRSWVHRRGVALGLALGSVVLGVVVLAAFVVGPLLGSGHDVADAVGLGSAFATAWNWARWPVVVVALVGWAVAIYHFAPNRQAGLRTDLPGAVIAAFGWIAASVALSAYLSVAGSSNPVFGTVGGALICLVWLYALAIALLLGGEVNSIVAQRRRRGTGPSTPL